ncbi:MAG: FAD-binding oxidoreductase [Pseudoalteromonas distincta]
MARITLANGKSFESQPDTSILENALQQGLTLEYSCKTGRCGVCRTTAPEGATRPLMPEEALTIDEIASGHILTCCRVAEENLTLAIEDLGELAGIQIKTLPCRIDSVQQVKDDVTIITLRLPPTTPLMFLPGQYVDIISQTGRRRSYSIANAPRADGKIELQIRHVPGGELSQYWFEKAKPNDLLRLEGPQGTFFLRQKKVSHLVFLATGTGIAPVKAILERISELSPTHPQQIHVYWGGRTEPDLYWQPPADIQGLRYVPVLSRGDGLWSGRKGYVQDAVIEDRIDLLDAQVYACGSESMIKSAKDLLTQQGLPESRFLSDAFVSSN